MSRNPDVLAVFPWPRPWPGRTAAHEAETNHEMVLHPPVLGRTGDGRGGTDWFFLLVGERKGPTRVMPPVGRPRSVPECQLLSDDESAIPLTVNYSPSTTTHTKLNSVLYLGRHFPEILHHTQ